MAEAEYTPQLALLVKAPPAGDEWVHEIKYDGYRIGCRIRSGAVTLHTRGGKDWTSAFPTIVAAAQALQTDDALLDGEIAVVLPDGRTSFQALQNAGGHGGRLVYFAFDILREGGERLTALPLEERKRRLKALLGDRPTGSVRYSDHVDGAGDAFFAQACRLKLEGIISKRRDAPYKAGRHGAWVKTKCVQRQEFVIGGFTDPEGARLGIGALLVGHYRDGTLIFAGKVGTGFTHAAAVALRRQLDALERPTPPFSPAPRGWLGKHAHWVAPTLVCEVAFTEWTTDGKVRHPSFQGLRKDKRPEDIVREDPVAPEAIQAAPAATGRRRTRPVPAASGGPSATRPQAKRARAARTPPEVRPAVAGVGISHPERVLYPDPPVTKLDVARYYAAVADWIVPHVAGRPLTLVRCPEGLAGECFYMKHSKVWARGPVRRVKIQEKTKVGEYVIADTIEAVVGLVQMGVLEIHTWNSVFEQLERPDRIVIDLDPGEEVTWPEVIAAAKLVRQALNRVELDSYVKTTGGRGLHVVIPLVPHAGWAECLAFSRGLATQIADAHPERYTTAFPKAGRERKILIDYLRNNRANTSIAAFSTRARPGAPVSVPVRWDELRASLRPDAFTVLTVPARLARLRDDPWKDYWTTRQRLTKSRAASFGAR